MDKVSVNYLRQHLKQTPVNIQVLEVGFFRRKKAYPIFFGGYKNRRRLKYQRIRIKHGSCQYCLVNPAETIDHLIPKSKGGTDSPNNLVACCKTCNQVKSNKFLHETNLTLHM